MNKLEKQILDIMNRTFDQKITWEQAVMMASIALELAEKAHLRGYLAYEDYNTTGDQEKDFSQFKQEVL